MKELLEKKNSLLDELDIILNKAQSEKRAFDDEELKKVAEIKEEVRKIEETVKLQEEVRKFEKVEIKKPENRSPEVIHAEVITKEERAFLDFVRNPEFRANLTAGSQGVIIPTTIANRIIDTVKNMSPILSKATTWDISGDLTIPSYDYTQHVPAGYYTELSTITAQAANFSTIKLGNTILVSLGLVSRSLLNRADVDLVPYVVGEIAKAMAYKLETELLNNANSSVGSGATKLGGLANATQSITGATTMVITPQELINLQLTVPQIYQQGAAWIMHPMTLGYIQGLTAGAGNNMLLMGNSLSESGPFTLLGKPVYVSDQMPQMGIGANEIFYGDFSGLHVKMTQGLQMQVLNELFANQYSIGCLASIEMDSCIVEPRKIAKYIGK